MGSDKNKCEAARGINSPKTQNTLAPIHETCACFDIPWLTAGHLPGAGVDL